MSDEDFAKKVAQMKQRKERREKRKNDREAQKQKEEQANKQVAATKKSADTFVVGDEVRMIGLTTVGTIVQVEGKMATVVFGDMRTKVRSTRLEHATQTSTSPSREERLGAVKVSRTTRDTIDTHRKAFKQELDVRGMRGDEALNAVQYYIDDAILMGVSQVRILHGKGNGILRQLIRDYLASVPNVVQYRDEHVQFGGAGITVVEL